MKMKYLYVDNFRGFQKTLIPIKSINFLIGENSTGKTSILSLLNLLSLPEFWTQCEFNTDQVDMGNFKDIVSKESNNRDYFRIGLLVDKSSNIGSYSFYMILMTFSEENGLPFLSRFHYMDCRYEMEFIISNGTINYRVAEAHKPDDLTSDEGFEIIKNWEEETVNNDFNDFPIFYNRRKDGRTASISSLMGGAVSEIYKKNESDNKDFLYKPSIPEVVFPVVWIAPIRSKPRRTYDRYKYTPSPDGEHSPYLIKKLLTDENGKARKSLLKFLEDFGVESNLFDSVEVNLFMNDPSSPFELMVRLNEKRININYVGYGVSQCLPLLVEMFSRERGAWYAVQQPEVHLHPKAQAALGGLIYNLAVSEKKNFLIETHSDYIIDRFRLNCRRKKKYKIDSQVLYFERNGKGNTVYPIDIEEKGNYSENQPKSFRDFFVKEQMDLLTLD
jgi:predicted ATPase